MSEEVWREDGKVTYISEGNVNPGLPVQLTRATEEKLRKFFQDEHDQELGRWRWPENPDYVVYYRDHGDHFVHVFHETDTAAVTIHRDEEHYLGDYDRAACAYFAALPEPKPWHDAKPGEVWLLTVAHEEIPALKDEDDFYSTKSGHRVIRYNSDEISTGRRIWPEGSNDS